MIMLYIKLDILSIGNITFLIILFSDMCIEILENEKEILHIIGRNTDSTPGNTHIKGSPHAARTPHRQPETPTP